MYKISRKTKIIGSISIIACLCLAGAGYGHIQATHRQRIHKTVKVFKSRNRHRKTHNTKFRKNTINKKAKKNTMPKYKRAQVQWHKGVPYVFHTKSLWLSNFLPANKYQRTNKIKYTRYITTLGPKNGFNTTPNMYSAQKVHMKYGVNNGSVASMNPHYQIVGHDKYVLTSGAKTKDNQKNIKLETKNTKDNYGERVLIQVQGSNEFNAWLLKPKNKKIFIGTYSRLPYNTKVALKALGAN